MKRSTAAALLALAAAIAAGAQSADEIVKSSRDRIKADTVSTRSQMIIAANSTVNAHHAFKDIIKRFSFTEKKYHPTPSLP